ncbi:hypothetical protein [Acidiphilium sp.]|uniref:hypothetical protein n=1 Tax=Acidiphilium sp. TaxID=527 RepID=UPI00258E8AC7|nr:hypothetical protein [Acidiphilium sp.]
MTAAAPASPGFLLRFAGFIAALCACVAAEGVRHRRGALTVLAWTRLRRLCARLEALATRPQAPARRRPGRPGRSGPPHRLPRAHGWLRRAFPATASLAPQLRALLDAPDMQAFIAATPAAGRVLRPLCHTIGIAPPPALALPPKPRPPRAAQVAATPDPPPDPAPGPTPHPPPPERPGAPRGAVWLRPPDPPLRTRFFPRS